MKFASGTELQLHLDGDRGPGLGAIFVGEKGKIEINRNKIASNPKELIRSPDNPGPNKRPETAYHIENWIECIKSRKRCNADIEIGQRATTLCYLVNIVRDVGRVGETTEVGPGRRAIHQLRRSQQAALPPAPQGLRIARRVSGDRALVYVRLSSPTAGAGWAKWRRVGRVFETHRDTLARLT